eukprot:COSAG02_NODE_821_length_16794_cov_42.795747_14_plen_179_part_00
MANLISPRSKAQELPTASHAEEECLVNQLEDALQSQSEKSLDAAVEEASKFNRAALDHNTTELLELATLVRDLQRKYELASGSEHGDLGALRSAFKVAVEVESLVSKKRSHGIPYVDASLALVERAQTTWVEAEATVAGLVIGAKICCTSWCHNPDEASRGMSEDQIAVLEQVGNLLS